jgi:RimJ/RimL family protein N-acetyltransferase
MKGVYSEFSTGDGRTIVLRPLRRGDLETMVPFANGFVREKRTDPNFGITSFDRRVTITDERRFLRTTLQEKAKRRRVSVAAFHGGRLVGHCDISGRPSPDERHTGMLGIVVTEGYRGVGLGEKMVRTALAEASKLGIWMIELEVFASNAPARHLYEKLGFKVVGVIPKKVMRDARFTDIVRMYTHLPHN